MNYSNYTWHLYLAQKAHEDFTRARRRAMLNKLISALFRRGNCLLSFSKAEDAARVTGHVYRGVREVPVSRIVGSVGRSRDFDGEFNPTNLSTRDRWVQLYVAALAGSEFPPVEVYLVGDEYYVSDGNHRVSIARRRGADYIEANVVEYIVDQAAPAGSTPEPACPCLTPGGAQHALPVL